MSYAGLQSRLRRARERLWAELEEAQVQDPESALDNATPPTREQHELNLQRLILAMGLRASANSVHSIEVSLKRAKQPASAGDDIAPLFERVVEFAENLVERDVIRFREAQKAYLNAQD